MGYVAGISPTNVTQVFRTMISWQNGEPKISWDPDLNENGTKSVCVYRVFSAKSLDLRRGTGYCFFKATVKMP